MENDNIALVKKIQFLRSLPIHTHTLAYPLLCKWQCNEFVDYG